MPFQPFSGESRAANFGTALGGGLGAGFNQQINSNLQQLAESKMNKMRQSDLANLFQKSKGLSADDANLAAWFAVHNPQKFSDIFEQLSYMPKNQLMQEQAGAQPAVQAPINAQDQGEPNAITPNILQQLQMQKLMGAAGMQNQRQVDIGQPHDARGILDFLQQNRLSQIEKTGAVPGIAPQDLSKALTTPQLKFPQQVAQPSSTQTQPPVIPGAVPTTETPGIWGGKVPPKLQKQIDTNNKLYNTNLDKKRTTLNTIADKAGQQKYLLDNGDVGSGWTGAILPARALGSDSEQFATLGKDIGGELTALQSGVQTASKIKWNEDRKANLGQNRDTQIARVDEILKDAAKGLLEVDLRDYLVEQNGDQQPANLNGKVAKLYNKLENTIPPVPDDAQEGEQFVDQRTGAIWQKNGYIMKFNGFITGGPRG